MAIRCWTIFLLIITLAMTAAPVFAAEPEVASVRYVAATKKLPSGEPANAKVQQASKNLLRLSPAQPPRELAYDSEIVVVSGSTPSRSPILDARTEVVIDRPGSRVILVLATGEKVTWEVKASRSTNIGAIIVSGAEAPVVYTSLSTRGYLVNLPYAYTTDHPDFQEMLNRLHNWFGIEKIDAFRGSDEIPARVVISKTDALDTELTVTGPVPQVPKENITFQLIDRNYEKVRWSLTGPIDQRNPWYTNVQLALSPMGDERYTVEENSLAISPRSGSKKVLVPRPRGLPETSLSSAIAYDTRRDIIAVPSFDDKGLLYRFDARKKRWLDFRSLGDADVLSLAYDQVFDRYVAWMRFGKLLFMDSQGAKLFSRTVIDRLPGLGRLVDRRNNATVPVIIPRGNNVVLVYFKGSSVAGIWNYDIRTNSATFTYKGPSDDSRRSEDNVAYDISRSWFQPSLTINRDPGVCVPLLKGYTAYFRSTRSTDPLQADFNGDRERTAAIATITEKLREVEWEDTKINEVDLLIARTQIKKRPLALIRRYYSIGWREGFFQDLLMTRPPARNSFGKDNVEEYFEANMFAVLAPGKGKNLFEVVHKNDRRYEEYESNTTVSLENVYELHGSVYLLVTADKPVPDIHLVFKVLNEKDLELTCGLQTTPTMEQINAQYGKLPSLKALRDDLTEMIGTEGSCGTLHPLGNAQQALSEALNRMSYRPWANRIAFEDTGRDNPDRRRVVDESLAQWGYSGIWNHRVYKSYLSHLPKAIAELKNFFTENFALEDKNAVNLAESTVSYALIAGFDHGKMEDNVHDLHKGILEGMDPEKLKKQPISDEASEDPESLLTFAIERPQLLKVLLERKLNPNAQNTFGKTPLMYAAQLNNLESARTLLEHGALTELTTVASGDSCNETIRIKNVSALHYAVRYASKEFVKLLLAHGAPTFIKDSEGYTPYDYLTKFGGFDGYEDIRKHSYGQSNRYLTKADREELAQLLLPPDVKANISLSRQENLKAERAYRQGQLEEAYRALRRALSLNEKNERALSNMSLVALKLGKLGESAKISTTLIKTAKSHAERASAHYNLGLACLKTSFLQYDGVSYCMTETYMAGGERKDMSALPNFLMAYKLQPTRERLNTVLAFVQGTDGTQKRRICRFPESATGVRSIYVGKDLYFLTDSKIEVPYTKLINTYGNRDRVLAVSGKEAIPLDDSLKLERWTTGWIGQGALTLDDMICAQPFPTAFGVNTRLVEVFSKGAKSDSDPPKEIVLRQNVSLPVMLILYGNNIAWTVEGDLSRTRGIYVYGLSTAKLRSATEVPMFFEKKSASPDPRDSSFNAYVRSTTGLTLSSAIDLDEESITTLTDQIISNSKYDPRTPRRPKLYLVSGSVQEAAGRGDLNAVRRLVENDKVDINRTYLQGGSALQTAAREGHYEIVVYLVSKGADVNARDGNDTTALHEASINGNTRIVEFLLSRGADVDARTRARDFLPLALAVIYGHERTAELLMSKGAGVNAADRRGVTALHHAAAFGRNRLVEILINGGADVNVMCDQGMTPLYRALEENNDDTAQLLISRGADINAKDVRDMTLLHTAVTKGSPLLVWKMIRLGSDLNAKDIRGRTPFDIAKEKGNGDIAVLIDRDAGLKVIPTKK
jgi:ankyrin repeat protein